MGLTPPCVFGTLSATVCLSVCLSPPAGVCSAPLPPSSLSLSLLVQSLTPSPTRSSSLVHRTSSRTLFFLPPGERGLRATCTQRGDAEGALRARGWHRGPCLRPCGPDRCGSPPVGFCCRRPVSSAPGHKVRRAPENSSAQAAGQNYPGGNDAFKDSLIICKLPTCNVCRAQTSSNQFHLPHNHARRADRSVRISPLITHEPFLSSLTLGNVELSPPSAVKTAQNNIRACACARAQRDSIIITRQKSLINLYRYEYWKKEAEPLSRG